MPAVTTMPYSCKNDLPQKSDYDFHGGAPFQKQWFESAEDYEDFCSCFANCGLDKNQVNWPYLMDTINGHYQHNVNQLRTELPEDVEHTWEPYVAMAMDWWYENNDSKKLRKDVSHLGGYIADYMNTELCCRSGRWRQTTLNNLQRRQTNNGHRLDRRHTDDTQTTHRRHTDDTQTTDNGRQRETTGHRFRTAGTPILAEEIYRTLPAELFREH